MSSSQNPSTPRHGRGAGDTGESKSGSHSNSSTPSSKPKPLTPGSGNKDPSKKSPGSAGKDTTPSRGPGSQNVSPSNSPSSGRSGDHKASPPLKIQDRRPLSDAQVDKQLAGMSDQHDKPDSATGVSNTQHSKIISSNGISSTASTAAEQANKGPDRKMLLARHLKQSIDKNTRLSCYRFTFRKDGAKVEAEATRRAEAIHLFVGQLVSTVKSRIMTDYQKNLVSESVLPENLTVGPKSSSRNAVVGLTLTGIVPWSVVLDFLDSAKPPANAADKEAALDIFKILLSQAHRTDVSNWNKERVPGDKKEQTITVLDVHSYPTDEHHSKQQPQSLASIMGKAKIEQSRLRSLETYIKGRYVRVDDADTGRKRTVAGFARLEDAGDSNLSHPPQIPKYGGSSSEISFFLKLNAKRGAGAITIPAQFRNRYITVAEYFKKVKKQKVERADLPVINVGTRRKPTYVLPEHCFLMNPPKDMITKVDHTVLEDIARATNQSGFPPIQCLERRFQLSGLKFPMGPVPPQLTVEATVASSLVPYRELLSPGITYANGHSPDTSSGAWRTESLAFKPGKKKPQVALLRIAPSSWTNDQKVVGTRQELQEYLCQSGIPLNGGISDKAVDMDPHKFDKKAKNAISEALKPFTKSDDPTLVVIVLPSDDQCLYDFVKNQCDIVYGIHNICIIARNILRKNRKDKDSGVHFPQIGLKLNLKTGGQNQILNQSFHSIPLGKTMIIGLETVKPSSHAREGARIIAAMVASKDHTLSQWPARVRLLEYENNPEEFGDLLKSQLEMWKARNDVYPENILIYHNGLVGDNSAACEGEISIFKKACEATYPKSSRPKITLIAVNKNHQAQLRFFGCHSQSDKSKQSGKEECIPVNSVLVKTRQKPGEYSWEFVIQGHQPLSLEKAGILASPTSELPAKYATVPVRYSVLKNSFFSGPEMEQDLENLTHGMCYLPGDGTASVTDTLPVHYVGLLCQRIQSYMRVWNRPTSGEEPPVEMTLETVQPNSKVEDKMFYI